MPTDLHWISDPGHGWLVVPMAEVAASGAEISAFSYRSHDGRLAFLEEDCDAPAFAKATGRNEEIRNAPERPGSPRHLPSYGEA